MRKIPVIQIIFSMKFFVFKVLREKVKYPGEASLNLDLLIRDGRVFFVQFVRFVR